MVKNNLLLKSLIIIFALSLKSNLLSQTKEIDPLELINPWRFSALAKYITVKYWEKGYKTTWADSLYVKHLFVENRPAGIHGLKNKIESFKDLISSIKSTGFDSSKSIISVGNQIFLDGDHRVATCIYFKKPVVVKYVDVSYETGYDYQLFKRLGLDEKYLDHMALEYAKLKKDTYIVILFPTIGQDYAQAKNILEKDGEIVYIKDIFFNKNGATNLIRHLYETENWSSFWNFDLSGAQGEAGLRFPINNKDNTRVILWRCKNLEMVKAAKEKIRKIVPHRSVIHINDFHEQTIYHCQVLFNRNSIDFLNKAKPVYFEKFTKYLSWYKDWLEKNKYDQENFCIDSSAILSAYGIRDCSDLDFFHFGYEHLINGTGNDLVTSHNPFIIYHATNKDNIIFNPDNYFYYKGLKFASLDVVIAMKKKRNEPKDKLDIELINKFL